MAHARAVRVRLKGIHTVRRRLADGGEAVHYYLRATKAKIAPLPGDERLPFKPGTPAFMRAYAAAIDAPRLARQRETFQEILTAYRKHLATRVEAKTLAPRTESDYLKQVARIEAKFGTMPIDALDEKGVRRLFLDWRDERAISSKKQADYGMQVLRQVLAFAIDGGKIAHNYAANPGKVYEVDRSEMVWLPEHERAFLAHATPEMRVAFYLSVGTGLRQGDLLKLTWKAIEGNKIVWKTRKRKKPVELPIIRELAAELRRAPRAEGVETVLISSDKAPWSQSGFQGAWRDVFLAAGLKDTGLHHHDLRGTTCSLLAEAGADDDEMGAVMAWSREHVAKMRQIYQATIRTKGATGIAKLADARRRRAESAKREAKKAARAAKKCKPIVNAGADGTAAQR